MNRWRPIAWLVVSVACFIGAIYFWRLGDKWQAQKPAGPAASATSNAPSSQATPAPRPMRFESTFSKSASTAPIAEVNPPATNAVLAKSSNAFPYRLSNTTKTVGQLRRDNHAILLENALIDSSSSTALQIPDSLRSHGDPGAYIVQASGPMTKFLNDQITAAGATIVSYIPNNAYLITGTPAVAAELGRMFKVQPWEPYYKVKAVLMPAALNGQPLAAANVAVFPAALEQTRAALDKMGITVVAQSRSPFGTQLVLQNVGSIADLAGLPGIEVIEPSLARMPANDLTRVIMNDSVDVFVPTNYLGLSGSNVWVAVADSWIPTNGATKYNPDLTNIVFDLNTFGVGVADNEGHATHVGGIIGGSGLHSPTNAVGSQFGADFRGKAPQSKLWALPVFSPFFTDATLQESAAMTNALISNNSWGYGTSDYNLAAASYDQAVRDSLPGATGSQPLIYVFSAGNSGNGGDNGQGGAPDTLSSPAVAKNVISVGASELPRNITNDVTVCDNCSGTNVCTTNKPWLGQTDSQDEVARFSSRGNVGIGLEGDFGRFKPDVIAPGSMVVSTRSMTWDTAAYYNITNHNVHTFFGDTVQTNALFNHLLFVPCGSVELDLFAASVNPPNVNLPIFARAGAKPTFTTFDDVGTNILLIPNITPLDFTWFYSVGNDVTNVPVLYNITSDLITTNAMGDYWDVLRTNLNDQLLSSNAPSGYPPTLYRYESGTSMSAPAVAGTLALMEDFFTNQVHYTPSPALMKAMLINGARSINQMYDFQVQTVINYQGWGLVNLTNSLPLGVTNSIVGAFGPTIYEDQSTNNALATGDSRTIFVSVDPNAQNDPLRVTLVWTDPPGNPAASIKLVNDLDLIVTNLDTVGDPAQIPLIYYGNDIQLGNTFNMPWDTNFPANIDNINNVENVYIAPALGTNYSITIRAHAINVNALTAHTNGIVQDYALVISSGNGDITNALTLTNAEAIIAAPYAANLTQVTNEFASATDISGGVLLNQHVGASSPLQGTNTLSLSSVTQSNWGTDGQITLGVSNQWHFYVITNTSGTNGLTRFFTNAVFATFLSPNLSIPPGGANGSNPDWANRPEADIDLYVARGPDAYKLTNLDAVVIQTADKSLSRGGTETITYTDAKQDEVFYVGVKSEDQEAAEYAFVGLFSLEPFSSMGPNGEVYLHGINVPTPIPDGSAGSPGVAITLAVDVLPITVRRAVVTNIMEHENFGDLFGILSHAQKRSVLNNHTFGNGNFVQQFVYEDNDEHDVPGSQHTDYPGSLKNFVGEEGIGLWTLTEVDNAPSHTGQVDNVYIRLDPQLGTNGIVATIQPQSFFYDFIDVPPDATNMTVCVEFLNGSPGPVVLDLRFGDFPTLNLFDYQKIIGNAPLGDCLTVSRADLPPLKPGRYYVGIYNPLFVAQTVRLSWSFGIDPNGVTPTPITSTVPPLSLPDDATTNSTIFITNNQNIVTVNVGVVLNHPRVSDLDLTLVAPTGQRILLFENRGGLSATNMGHLNIFTNFFGATASGTALANTNFLGPVPTFGTLIIDYDFFDVPDTLDVYDGPLNIYSTGSINHAGTITIPYNLLNGNLITIVMNKGNNPVDSTAWTYTPRVVSEDFTYLTFTDDTNVTDMPIKFAIPPYNGTDDGTNFVLNNFEFNTNGEYFAPASITDSNGGWTLITNDVFVRTNYFGDTNLLSMATNEVSVVSDPNSAAEGSNFLALARGSISRTLTNLIVSKNYTLSYRYRGPGVAGWWRGEGNATDSADPEKLGNNGSLIGRFNFPAGEVGQAFALEDSGLAFQFAGTNTYVQVPQSSSLNVGLGSGFTVEGWINPTNITYQQPMVEWLAKVPTNTVVKGVSVTNLVIQAGPFLNRETGHYYYLLSQTNWSTSELWANALGGHLVELDDANEQNWVYDTFAQFAGSNYTMWIGLSNGLAPKTNFTWSTGNSNVVYTNWAFGQPTNCLTSHFVAVLSATNGLPGQWVVLDNNGNTCGGQPTNKPFGVVEVNEIQTNGVQFWISVTDLAHSGQGRLYANIFDTNGVPHEIFSPAGLIQSNMFQHVALTYNTNTGVANLYYSGTNVASTNLGIFVPKTGGDVLIGKDMSRITNNFFWGRMDEMSIYSRYLSPAEIAAIYRISATTNNRNIGKFDPTITPALSLGEAQVSFGGITNLIYGANSGWQVQGFSFKAFSNSLPMQFTGIEPGVLLDTFSLFQKPPGNLYYFPEQPLQALVGSNALGNWTLEIRDARTGAVATNAELVSWQLQFILQTNTPTPIQLSPQSPSSITVPPGQIAYFSVFVPGWANYATNILVSASSQVDLLFNQTTPPGLGSPGDVTFLNNQTSGNFLMSANPPSTPPLLQGQTYYLGVRNSGAVPSTVTVRVDFNMTTLSNGIPVGGILGTNDLERPFVFFVSSNATEATFQLLKMTGNADLVLRKGLPLPTLLSADYGSFSGSNADETIYVLTNSLPVPLSQGPWYLDVIKRSQANDPTGSNVVTYSVLAKELTNAPSIINLANRVPLNYTAGPGAALTNFFKFSVTNFPQGTVTNLGLRFELFAQTGNGDLTVQTNALPLAPPFLQSSRLPFNNAEIIFIRTNTSSSTNLNADWYLGVPNNETNPISFTILAELETNSFAAFPAAEGSGAYTRGGALSTNVYHVTTLFDSGAGSFRNGVNILTNGGTIVFDVTGTINLSTPLVITNSYLTIAGQTAPGGGVTVAGAPTVVQNAHDLIIRYLRFRPPSNNIDINGSFETPAGFAGAVYSAGQTFGGWTVLAGSVDDVPAAGGWQAADGSTSLDLNGFTTGAISRTVPTVSGKTYNLRFAYSANPGGGVNPKTMQVLWNGTALGNISAFTNGVTFADMHWIYTNFTVVGTGSDSLEFASTTITGPTQFGPTLDAVSLTSGAGDSLEVTNASNVVFDHISAEFGATNDISVLNSSNVTVQWSVLADSQNPTDSASGGSEIRYGSGDVTFHHNLYADNYSGNPTIGEDVSLDFVNNVIFNWGLFSGFSTNDLANNPGGLTNFLNYSANYLIAGSNSVFTNVAFWGGTSNTWIFQTNNFIDTNRNSILDGANTSWGMFSNQYTRFDHAFDILPPTAPDEAFIAYERVLDFAGSSLEKRDLFDRAIVQRVRLQPGNTNATAPLSGMSAWWKAENNANDSIGVNNGVFNGAVSYVAGEVGNAFNFNGASYVQVPDGPGLRFTNVMSGDVWINLTNYSGFNEVFSKYDTGPNDSYTVGIDPSTHKAYFICNSSNNVLVNVQVFTASPIPLNTWTHLAVVVDGTTAKIFMNGILSGSLPWTQGIYHGADPLSIGCTLQSSPTSFFKGQIDELSLYKRPLTDCEISAIFNAGPAGKQSILSAATNSLSATNLLPYLDIDRDGIPDFWEITLNENPTNFSPNLDRDGDGYTDLEEYMNWLGVPHALTITNTQANVNLYVMSGKTGNLLFGVANGTNGTVYLTNDLCILGGASDIAVFTPTNNFGGGTNYGFGSFTYMVTNTDTMAYFGPVTVSVFVSAVPITNAALFTNVVVFTNPPPSQTNFEMVPFSITNGAVDSDPAAVLTYTISMVIDTNATVAHGWPLTNLTVVPGPVIDANGIITWTPTEAQGPGVYIITTTVADNGIPPAHATNTFSITVNESNRPPVFVGTPPNQTNTALSTFVITNSATDPDIPGNPLTYTLLSPPAGMTIDTNGVITWTPTVTQVGPFIITTVVTDTNAFALTNNSLSVTNVFTIVVTPVTAPYVFTQPAQAVTGTGAKLNGMVTPNGLPTTAWFEWGTNTLYGNQTPAVGAGNGYNVFYTPAAISGLSPNVPYHFRLVASNLLGVVYGFDQILDEANVVAWGADYVHQVEVPTGLSNNVAAIAGAYDHSLAVKNDGTVTAWGDNTFSQTNVPAGLNNVLAVAGGQYSSMALKNTGTVMAWGGNILSVTNVPPGLNNVVMIAGGTYASLALRNNGSVVSWGANFFNLTNLPAGLNNVVEVAGGSYHSLAIRNDGTVVAWGDNSAGQTNVPPSATNIVAIAGGNYHSLALRYDGTVVSWGDNSSGQTNVPVGLSNVVAIAAGGFHSLALKSDGTIVGWGDNTAGQSRAPVGLSNVVAISSGYFHSLALTPTLPSTNSIVLDITNGVPQTNSILGGSIVFYRVEVPVDADAATNTLFFTLNGPLNVWYSTNVPPTVGVSNDFQLMTNAFTGTSVVATATSPQLMAGKTYYLGLQNTNSFSISYVVGVEFHLVPIVPLTNGVPVTNAIPSGGLIFYEVDVPTNADFATNLLTSGTAPLNVWFSTNVPPTITNADDFLLISNAPSGSSVLSTSTIPQLVPGSTYYLGVQNTNGTAVSYGIGVNFHFVPIPPLTNGVPTTNTIPSGGLIFYEVDVPTNADFATNLLTSGAGPLNVWFSTNVPPTITNPDDFLLISNAPSGSSVLSGSTVPQLVPGSTYYLGIQNTGAIAVAYGISVNFHFLGTTPPPPPIPTPTVTKTNINGTNGFLLVWYAPTNEFFQVQWSPGLLQPWNTFTNIIGFHNFIDPTNSEFEFFDDGSQTGGTLGSGRIYRLILLSSPPPPLLTGGTPATDTAGPGAVKFYQVNVPTNADYATNLLVTSTLPVNFWFTTNAPPTITNGNDVLLVTNATLGSFTSIAGSGGPPSFIPGSTYYLGVQNTNATSAAYTIEVQFHLIASAPVTNAVPISSIIHTNNNGTNAFLLVWYAPASDLFQVQWSPGLLQPWNTFTNIVSYHNFISATNSEFEFLDDGSQTGGTLGSGRIYRLILLNSSLPTILPLTNSVPASNSVAAGAVTFYQVNVPTNADYGTNRLLSADGPLNVWFSTNYPPTVAGGNDSLLIPNAASGSATLNPGGTPKLVPGSTYYLGVQNTGAGTVNYAVQVDFHLFTSTPSTNPIPISSVIHTNNNGTNAFLLVWYAPASDLFQVQWSPGLLQPWNTFTNIIGYHNFISATNSEFEFLDDGSQTGGSLGSGRIYRLVLLNTPPPPAIPTLTNSVPTTNSVTPSAVTFYQVNVPTNADYGTNLLLSASGPLKVWFSTNVPPTITNANDFLLIPKSASGSATLNTSGTPKLIPGGTYYLGVQNPGAGSVSYSVRVDFHLSTGSSLSTNPVPISSVIHTNVNGTNAFLLVWYAPASDLFQVQWSSTFPPSWFTFTNIIAYNTFISATNSEFEFIDNGSQSGGLGSLRYYRLVLYNPASPSVTVIPLTNGVPINFTTGAGQTNFFSFDITQTNASVLFELYNLTGNGDLTLQSNSLPLSPPYFTNSSNAGTNFEQIVLRTNSSLPNLNAVSWFLGVPNQSLSPINYTIRAVLPTNGILVSGLPINTTSTQPGGTNVHINWSPTVIGEKYDIRTNSNLVGPNWGTLTTLVATGTSMSFTDPITPSGPPLYYRVVQVP